MKGILDEITDRRHPLVRHLKALDHVGDGLVVELWELRGVWRAGQSIDDQRERLSLPIDSREVTRRCGTFGGGIDLYGRRKVRTLVLRRGNSRPRYHADHQQEGKSGTTDGPVYRARRGQRQAHCKLPPTGYFRG